MRRNTCLRITSQECVIFAAFAMEQAMKTVQVNYIESFGTQDGPGVRMVIFTQGCHLKCLYCQNPDTIAIKGGTAMTWEELYDKAMRQKEYFGKRGGVTVSGGEPLLHAEALLPLFQALHHAGISTALDTNGFIWNHHVEALLAETDFVLLDIKHIDPHTHKKLTGVQLSPILEFAQKIRDLGKRIWLRYVLVPGWSDSEQDLRNWARFARTITGVERVEVLPYHTLGVPKYAELGMEYMLPDVKAPTKETKELTRHIFEEEGLQNIVVK
ncbi:MAG: pyruvate formate-lyase-activating protein [Niabella sp.]